jgi:Ca2+-transporting ATPase
VEARQAHFGRSFVPPPPPESIFALIVGALDDITIQMLLVCGIFELGLGLGFHDDDAPTPGWLEGVALLVTVTVVVLVNAVLDFQKQMQFRALSAANDDSVVAVTRDGVRAEIDSKDIVVGDLLHIIYGQAIPCDGLYVSGESFEVDESALTGEPDLCVWPAACCPPPSFWRPCAVLRYATDRPVLHACPAALTGSRRPGTFRTCSTAPRAAVASA